LKIAIILIAELTKYFSQLQLLEKMDETLRWRITTFFNYWRQRHAFIRDLDFSKHSYEANVLLWASLDALSNLWANNIGKQECSDRRKRLIFDAFLARYGGEVFQIVSLPNIWNRIDQGNICVNQQKKLKLSQDICTFLKTIGGRRTPTFTDECELRHSSDDWSMDMILTTILADYPNTDRTELKEWLIFSRYGAIAYKEMRSAYIHEGRPGKNSHSFELGESATRPTYLSGIYTTPPKIGFGVEFMLSVLASCIDAFEADALTLQKDPVPK